MATEGGNRYDELRLASIAGFCLIATTIDLTMKATVRFNLSIWRDKERNSISVNDKCEIFKRLAHYCNKNELIATVLRHNKG